MPRRSTRAEITAAIADLTGEISQVPSRVSAIKVGGRRAYDLARAGEEVELAARSVTVSRFEVVRPAAHRPASSTSTWSWTAPAARTSARSRGISVRRSASAGT